MGNISYNDGILQTFLETTAGGLDGKEDLLVEQGAPADTVAILATPAKAMGVMRNKLQDSEAAINVRLLNGGGSARMVQDAAIAKDSWVVGQAGGRVIAWDPTTASAGTYLVLGRKKTFGNGVQADVIEVLLSPFLYTVPA